MPNATAPIERSSWKLWRIAACFVAGVAVAGAGAAGGVLLGATYGGRYAPQFEFAGVRGYEATGLIGELAGLVVAGLLSFYPVRRLTRAWIQPG